MIIFQVYPFLDAIRMDDGDDLTCHIFSDSFQLDGEKDCVSKESMLECLESSYF